MNVKIKVLTPTGAIGTGFPRDAFEKALLECPDVIAMDAGSTDSGPHYLGTGTTKSSASILRAELGVFMQAREKLGIPLIIGSCGTCGSDAGVDLMRGLCEEVAAELGQTVRIAGIYSEQPASAVKTALLETRIKPLQLDFIDDALVDRCSRIVALMGVEPFIHALQEGADIILAGRSTDTAVMASLPIMRGGHPGAAWHAGKILECGASCTTTPAQAVVMATIDETGFTIEAIGEGARLTPRSVMAHMLYENSNPYVLVEPGGVLDVEGAVYTAIDERTVRVEGSIWKPSEDYTVKLEGAAPCGFQSVVMSIVRDTEYLERFDEWLACLDSVMRQRIEKHLNIESGDYDLQFRAIGKNAALGDFESRSATPVEIGVMALATSATAERTKDIVALLNPYLLHFPLPGDKDLPTHAFPFSPASMDRGVVYEFVLSHVMVVANPLAPFRFDMKTIEAA